MQLFLYVHTHWDREWYLPFESFRCQLPTLLDKVLTGLDNGTLPNFYLDGQAAIITDALEIAPHLASGIKAQMAAGKLSAGPWYILADQMLVSGESLIRNLRLGLKTTAEFGRPAMIGYCPDTFGHSQDLPRILSGFGINNAIVWRGVGEVETNPVFWWQSPDGSRVLTYHLNRGYYQTQFHDNKDLTELSQSLKTWLNHSPDTNHLANAYCSFIDGALCPVGGDHIFPPSNFAETIENIDQKLKSEGVDVWVIQPADFINLLSASITASNAELSTVSGELRDNSQAKLFERAFLLPGVLSTRLYLKRANRLAEHRITNIIEPLYSLLAAKGIANYPHHELDRAWQLLLQNQPHDSICGCSVDEVHREMMVRTDSFNNILGALEKRARAALSTQTTEQVLAENDPTLKHNNLTVFNLSGKDQAYPIRLSWWEEPSETAKKSTNVQIISSQKRDELFSGPGITPYYKIVEYKEGWIWPGLVPGIGVSNLDWSNSSPKTKDKTPSTKASSTGTVKSISNEILTVSIAKDGHLTAIYNTSGQQYDLGHRLRDVGDGGDTYNFDPLANDQPIEAKFLSAKVGQKGPLVSSLILTYEMKIPEEVLATSEDVKPNETPELSRSSKLVTHKFQTEVSLRKNVAIVFFETTWDNKSKDHRLEVLFNTGSPVNETHSENHFSLVRREHKKLTQTLPVEIGTEATPDRLPCQRFFIANEQLFLNTGLPEYAVDNKDVAVTLLRAVSLLSRGRIKTRGGGAGPHLPTPEANCLGLNKASYGWAPLSNGDPTSLAYNLAEQFEGRLWASLSKSSNNENFRFIKISNDAIRVVSMTFTALNEISLRLLNTSASEQKLQLEGSIKTNEIKSCTLANDQNSVELTSSISFKPFELLTIGLSI